MSVSVLSAAKFIGDISDWSKTNLELQKIIYIAHMLHLGEQESVLVEGNFQAWYLGPVHPDLYHHAKVYGSEKVQNIFNAFASLDVDSPESRTLKRAYGLVGGFSGSRLIAITHCNYGAWEKNYKPGARNIVIPNVDILNEYHKRVELAKRRQGESQSK